MEGTKTSYPKEKVRILFLENISDAAIRNFRQQGYTQVEKITKALSEEELIREIRNVHILGIRSKTQITAPILAASKKLQAIGCFCIGVNQVDLRNATRNGVVVFNAPYSNTRSVAELVIGASIMLIRRIPEKNKAAHDGIWMKDSSGSYELRGIQGTDGARCGCIEHNCNGRIAHIFHPERFDSYATSGRVQATIRRDEE